MKALSGAHAYHALVNGNRLHPALFLLVFKHCIAFVSSSPSSQALLPSPHLEAKCPSLEGGNHLNQPEKH